MKIHHFRVRAIACLCVRMFWIRKGICKMLPVDVLAPSCVCDTNLSGDCVYPTHGDHNGDHSGWGDLAKIWLRRAGGGFI